MFAEILNDEEVPIVEIVATGSENEHCLQRLALFDVSVPLPLPLFVRLFQGELHVAHA